MNQPVYNGQLVAGLMESVGGGKRDLTTIPKLVRKIIKEEMWKEFYIDRTKQFVKHDSFAAFVAAQPMEGLGINLDLLKRICRDDASVFDLIDQAEQGRHGGDRRSEGAKSDIVTLDSNQRGNTRQHALRKLRKERPDLHAQVLANKLSPHAAMVEAGFRNKTMTVPTDPTLAAQYIHRRLATNQLEVFFNELSHLKAKPEGNGKKRGKK
jgi:hypothetical protein